MCYDSFCSLEKDEYILEYTKAFEKSFVHYDLLGYVFAEEPGKFYSSLSEIGRVRSISHSQIGRVQPISQILISPFVSSAIHRAHVNHARGWIRARHQARKLWIPGAAEIPSEKYKERVPKNSGLDVDI